MKIFITGGTGFTGSAIVKRLLMEGHHVTVMTRKKHSGDSARPVSYVQGDPTEKGEWQELLADFDVIINLAGASIFRRWTEKNKKVIRDSRILTTQNLVHGLAIGSSRNRLLINTSAVGYYGFRGDEKLTEDSPQGTDFLATLCAEWEGNAAGAAKYGVRVVTCRFGIVLGKEGGVLSKMTPVYRYYLGSPIGNGGQYFSWIHMEDLVSIVSFLIENSAIKGPVNCTSPNPVRNRDLTEALGKALKKPTFMPAIPGFLIRLIMGEFGDTIIKGQKVIPEKLIKNGFTFSFPDILPALENILR